jgi:hypothetical protein
VRFSKLHETRAEVIANIYRLMVETNWQTQAYAYCKKPSDEATTLGAEAVVKITKLRREFELHRLYLPDSLCVVLDRFVTKINTIVLTLTIYFPEANRPGPTPLQQSEKMLEIAKAFETEVPALKELLETEFRKLLGATDEEWLTPVPAKM